MIFVFDGITANSPLIELGWRTRSVGGGSFISSAASNMELVFTRQQGKTWVTVRGAETRASRAPVPEDAEFMGIAFKLGTFMPPLPTARLIDGGVNLPEAGSQSFWLHGSAWELPTAENVDVFIARLVRQGLLVRDEVVAAALQDHPLDVSARTIRRRFLHATGVTHKTIQQIERARQAVTLLQQGVPILDAVAQTGYFDQAHMTKALRHFMGQTPAQIVHNRDAGPLLVQP